MRLPLWVCFLFSIYTTDMFLKSASADLIIPVLAITVDGDLAPFQPRQLLCCLSGGFIFFIFFIFFPLHVPPPQQLKGHF